MNDGQNRGSDSGDGIGSDSGDASGNGANGSDFGIDGSGGDSNGDDRGTERAGTGNDISAIFRDTSVDESTSNNDEHERFIDGNQNPVNPRNERIRQRRVVRLGSADRDRDSSTATDSAGSGERERDSGHNNQPNIRLGATGRGRPKKVGVDSSPTDGGFKISETKELISVFVSSIFEIPAITLKQDFWRLSKEETKMFSDALVQWLNSMPKSQSSKVAQFISAHLPLVNLCMIGFFILSERVRMSIAVANIKKHSTAFDLRTENAQPTQTQSTVQTPMDKMFS